MANYSKKEIQKLIDEVGLTQASKQFNIGFNRFKEICKEMNIIYTKKTGGRKKKKIEITK